MTDGLTTSSLKLLKTYFIVEYLTRCDGWMSFEKNLIELLVTAENYLQKSEITQSKN